VRVVIIFSVLQLERPQKSAPLIKKIIKLPEAVVIHIVFVIEEFIIPLKNQNQPRQQSHVVSLL
jgi:hypothetical protein